MLTTMYIGSSPADKECVYINCDNYRELARKECNRFIVSLRAHFGMEPAGARLKLKWNPHEFGTYASVECEYDIDVAEAVAYALVCEGNCPEKWEDFKEGGGKEQLDKLTADLRLQEADEGA